MDIMQMLQAIQGTEAPKAVDQNKLLQDHLERVLILAFPQISSSPIYGVIKPLVEDFFPNDITINEIATGILNREGEIWDAMEMHLKAIVAQHALNRASVNAHTLTVQAVPVAPVAPVAPAPATPVPYERINSKD